MLTNHDFAPTCVDVMGTFDILGRTLIEEKYVEVGSLLPNYL